MYWYNLTLATYTHQHIHTHTPNPTSPFVHSNFYFVIQMTTPHFDI